MFTKNNYLLKYGKKYGDEYEKVSIEDIDKNKIKSAMALALPNGGISFETPIEEVIVDEQTAEMAETTPCYRCVFENSQGEQYIVEMIPNDVEVFCKFSKFKNMNNMIQWAANFAGLDWKGLPVKMIHTEIVPYVGKTYKPLTKPSPHNLIISGIVFNSREDTKLEESSGPMEE